MPTTDLAIAKYISREVMAQTGRLGGVVSLFVIVLLALLVADSVAAPQPRPTRTPAARVDEFDSTVTTEGNSVARTSARLVRWSGPSIVAQAEFMTVGPPGPYIPDTVAHDGFHVENPVTHRLRVTLGSSEQIRWLLIDDIVTGRADSRRVNASYMFDPFVPSAQALSSALENAPRVLGDNPEWPPITWINPTSFVWITRADTLVFEQKADSIFSVTLRARVR